MTRRRQTACRPTQPRPGAPGSGGEILLDSRTITGLDGIARTLQPIVRDPSSALTPRHTVGPIITLPLRLQGDPEGHHP